MGLIFFKTNFKPYLDLNKKMGRFVIMNIERWIETVAFKMSKIQF
ncbi:hypothetical protein SAMN05421639_1011057 [Chryseobacterium shigense]|uniref:Uncharacterized protein n=1 Tax=Chryseobacterium shigense TaxID=297244 RepID=A0A1N7I1M4_9FLAO|nr:hypothetical protein SAMN05421639_1011057 [Chryseobacterium shigense]